VALVVLVTAVAMLAAVGTSVAKTSHHAAKAAAAGGLPAGCSKPVGSKASNAKLIVTDLPLQGALRPLTTEINAAASLILHQWNFKAGKYPIQFATCDDSTAQAASWDPTTCTNNAKQYAQNKKVVAIVGTFNSGCAELEMPITNRAGLLMVSPANTLVGLTRPSGLPGEPQKWFPTGKRNYTRVVAADSYQGAAISEYMKGKGYKSVYILNDGEAYGVGVATTVANSAKHLGIKVLGDDKWDEKAPNYVDLWNKVKATNPDVVFVGGIVSANGAQLIKDKASVLGDNTKVPLIGPDGFNTSSTQQGAGAAAEGMIVTIAGVDPNQLSNAGAVKFRNQFKKQFHVKQLQAYTAYGADAVLAALTAIKKSNGTRSGVTSKAYGLSFPNGITGNFSIDKYGDRQSTTPVTFDRIQGTSINAFVVIKPTAADVKSTTPGS
jgi:branched-chain amino acid transport system substrate-binding protein